MLTRVRLEERTIRIPLSSGTERTVTFPTRIAEVVGFAQVVAVRCDADPYMLQDRNVFGVTDTSAEVWRVDARMAGSICTGLSAQGEHLIAALGDGRAVLLDPMTGRLLQL